MTEEVERQVKRWANTKGIDNASLRQTEEVTKPGQIMQTTLTHEPTGMSSS